MCWYPRCCCYWFCCNITICCWITFHKIHCCINIVIFNIYMKIYVIFLIVKKYAKVEIIKLLFKYWAWYMFIRIRYHSQWTPNSESHTSRASFTCGNVINFWIETASCRMKCINEFWSAEIAQIETRLEEQTRKQLEKTKL